ncbi:MAG: class I SAM-dependent methyltransferase [Rhodobiaceae bacterium]|nr:class I SAM-dependent methyltransferase [Rhodobiaceae bacterium]MCC0042159.1 class I SAM-dependent methyltransferase [Rhodobiaceae bacterium]
MTGLSSRTEPASPRKPFGKLEALVRETGKGAIRGLYSIWAATYDKMLVAMLGYQAPDFVARALAPLLPEGEIRVLDVGCGTGLTAEALLAHRKVEVDGIDFSPEMIERARGKGIYGEFFRADVTRPLPIPAGTYDAAISSGLFTHGHVGAEAIPHVLKAIRPGGLFAFSVYWKVWDRGGFSKMLAKLEAGGEIEILHNERESHFRTLKGQQIHTVVVRVTG